MVNTKKLTAAFQKAGLVLEIVKKPMRKGAGMDEIVQIDVHRAIKGALRGERFRMFLPEHGAVTVRNGDAKLKQVVVMVQELEREFEEELTYSRWGGNFIEWVADMRKMRGQKVLKVFSPNAKRKTGSVLVQRKTENSTRYFLMGEDERQLFIAQLSRPATTVAEAHKALGATVQFAEGKRRGSSIDRQGEWFFLETSQAQRDRIDGLIEKNKIGVKKKVSIGQFLNRAGQPHRADELVVLGGEQVANKLGHGFSVRPTQVYIRGAVKHPDHKTQKFHQWREVVGNSEGATSQGGASGVFWVD